MIGRVTRLLLLVSVAFTSGGLRSQPAVGSGDPVPALSVEVDGVRINYEQHLRSNDDRPTLVLIHGFGASLDTWNDIYPALTAERSVVRIDLKGSGFSDKPRDDRYAPADHARLLLGF